MRILLDLDGVVVDFVGGACKAHGRSSPYAAGPPSSDLAECYWMPDLWEMPIDEFWKPMEDPKFWEGLEFMPDGLEILKACEEVVGKENVCLLTNPTKGSGPVVGKINWIEENLPEYRDRNLIGKPKEFCAHAGSVLVDDSNHNIDTFEEAGGMVIMVPRPWNRLFHYDRETPVDWVRNALESYKADPNWQKEDDWE